MSFAKKLQELRLGVERIASVHGRTTTIEELNRAMQSAGSQHLKSVLPIHADVQHRLHIGAFRRMGSRRTARSATVHRCRLNELKAGSAATRDGFCRSLPIFAQRTGRATEF